MSTSSSPGSPKQPPPEDRRSSLYASLPSFGVGEWYNGAREQFKVLQMAEGAVKGAVGGVSNALPEKTKRDMQEMVKNVDTKLGQYVVEPVEKASGVVSDGVKKVKDASGIVKDGVKMVTEKSVEGVNVAKEKVVEGVDKTVESAGVVKEWLTKPESGENEGIEGEEKDGAKLSTSSLYQSLPSVPTGWYKDAKNQYTVIQAAEGAVVGAVEGVCQNVPGKYKEKAKEIVETADEALGTYVAKPLEKTSGIVASGAGIVKEGVTSTVGIVKGGINVISNGVEVVKEKVEAAKSGNK